MDKLDLQFTDEKVYIIRGKTLNKLVAAINERTPLPQSPLTKKETKDGVEIGVTTVDLQARVEALEAILEGFAEETFEFCEDGSPVSKTILTKSE